MKKLIKIKDILGRIPVSRSTLYNWIAAGKFPSQVHLGGYGAFWVEDEIDAWLTAQVDAERGLNPEAATLPDAAWCDGIVDGIVV
jgi:prophage regulatory protein